MFVLGGTALGLNRQATYEQEAQNQSAYYAKDAVDQIEQSCVDPTALEKARCIKNAVGKYRLERRDKQREYDDLAAQRTSALWTSIMGVAALIGMGLSAVGVALVFTTFREQRRTNSIAMRENARATRRAVQGRAETARAIEAAVLTAKAANEANDLAREAASSADFDRKADGLVAAGQLRTARKDAADTLKIATRNADAAAEQVCISEETAKRNADAAAEQVCISEETAKRQLRAYVFPTGISWELRYTNDTFAMLFFSNWKNLGQTPTRDLSVVMVGQITNEQIRGVGCEFDGTSEVVRFQIGPNVEVRSSVVSVAETDLDAIWSGTKFLYLAGLAKYKDVFGDEQRVTRFGYNVTILRDNSKPLVGDNFCSIEWQVAGPHNCADEECERLAIR